MKSFIKNLEHSKVLPLIDQVDYADGQIVSKTLAQNREHSLTLFAFEKNEEISTHSAGGDAFVYALDGVAKIVISGQEYELKAGDCIVMPANEPHSVFAKERFKMLLTVLFS
ncbi:MAG: cupin domain-containing protein [Vagococcus sp.]|nr:cupin domain-containing protein [Vagococcus sp.]